MIAKIRVLVVDDSAFMRHVISDILSSDPRMEVVGTARDGLQAIEMVKALRPDVVTLDVEMPRMDGLQALQRIMSECPTRVVMFSSLTQRHARVTIRALSIGAVDFVPKPTTGLYSEIDGLRRELISKVVAGARSRLRPVTEFAVDESHPVKKANVISETDNVVVIGSSTGGPSALQQVMRNMPGDLDAAVLLVQHMPPGFTRSLAERLNDISPLDVQEATGGETLSRGRAIMAPGGFHMTFEEDRRIILTTDPPRHGVRPAVDVTMEAAVSVFRSNCVGVILTGMGFDGSKGCSAIKAGGGRVIAEHESTCVVYGMPRAVVEMGYADTVVPIGDVARAVEVEVAGLGRRRCKAV